MQCCEMIVQRLGNHRTSDNSGRIAAHSCSGLLEPTKNCDPSRKWNATVSPIVTVNK